MGRRHTGVAQGRRASASTALALAALIAALAIAVGVPSTARAALALRPCTSRPSDRAQCGRVAVPLDRSGALPGTVDLRVRVLPPAAGRTPAATVFGIAGGPGQAAAPLLERFARALGPAARSRSIVAFDQRGTGGSDRLSCTALSRPLPAVVAVGQCAAQLGPARSAYTTAASVADLEAVRAALGVDRVVLYGTSYGTKLALAYAAAYPQHVDRLVLDSVVSPDGVDPFQRATLASVSRVLDGVCAGACRFTRDPAHDVAALVRRLARRPLHGAAIDGAGRRQRIALGRTTLYALLLAGDFAPSLRDGYPAAVTGALRGDPAPLARLVLLARGGLGGVTPGDSDAVFVATSCEDGHVPWPPGTPIADRDAVTDQAAAAIPGAAFSPFDRATIRSLGLADLCRRWPESPIVQPTPPPPDVPALILSGDDDLRTPRSDALALAALLPRAQVLEVAHTGHGVLGAEPTHCARDAAVRFLDTVTPPGARGLSTCASRALVPAAPLAPTRLADVAPFRGLRGRVGRTVSSLALTLDDASRGVLAHALDDLGRGRSFGGLRAGRATILPGAGLLLRGYAYVPGVTVTGLLPVHDRPFTFVLGGAAGAHGRVTISRQGIAGTLDGRPVHVGGAARRLAALSASPAR